MIHLKLDLKSDWMIHLKLDLKSDVFSECDSLLYSDAQTQTLADVGTNYTYQELLQLSQGSSDCVVGGLSNVTNKVHLRSHMTDNSSSGNDELQCKLCGKHFSTRQSLQRHSVIHTGEKPFSCHICQRRFNQKSNLRTHLVVHMKI
ncbi:hypothetical protein DPMN_156977 [Dreissena polymorpha]|uniref:C2H2-type domain-containing protein n=1 Tax=Dreissena polymorpha TaxID=45954 RepID=A0A9D4FQT3_DREPO|nr:hypothetical protein DPMN_156977 [Dreissena polymorpha]